jgi:radical SAM superfamily enzyme YgiQ (UPF0313 family)
MKQNGHTVSFFDTMFARDPAEIIPTIDSGRPDLFVIYDDGFNYLTKMCLTNMREAAFKMIAIAKERGCMVVVSSSDSTDHYRQYLEAGADVVILGEAEQTLLELLRSDKEGNPEFNSIQGIAYRKVEEFITTAKRKLMTDLDRLPLPAWDLVNLEAYREMWEEHAGFFSVNISTTRGCPFRCNWCAKPIYGNRYHARSPQNVVNEIKLLMGLVSFDHIWFCDDIFGLKPGWVKEFAALLNREGLRIKFKIQSRADLLLQEDYVSALAMAGCEEVWLGAESGSQKILDAMDKGIRVEEIASATERLRAAGILPCFFIQFGYPGETMEDIMLTIDMINRLLPEQIGISVSYPLPGTKFHEMVKEELQRKSNWTDSDDLALMFRNTYPPAFYRRLHRYVHRSYRRQLAVNSLKQLLRQPFRSNWTLVRKAATALHLSVGAAIDKLRLNQAEVAR